ncbi:MULTISPECIES: tetratricopeptide repeat protein [unclassified Francisella]|uniref:tetratricopeptide repeat protein n=1 Tax=unclassified Francisella TaxID=2610885 RepID=UPI002E33DE93|nr:MULTISPECIES: sel1 repeat family protein [unclassified Francisella]MED7820298.1 sel1 repeat family protein [Francisella sp. 19S2-4]MED7831130.1 sel1 repeat family protein [Francisella sp. 19S2-10]
MKARLIVAFLSILFFSSSYATLEQCYKSGIDGDYGKVLESCKPYTKTDARATGLLAEAYIQLDENDQDALNDALWAIDFYKKNGVPAHDKKSYAYLLYLVGELYYFGSNDIKVDQQKGLEYIIEAAKQGYAIAQNQLGNFYVRAGSIPAPNFAKAYKWYKLAIANGSVEARSAFLINNEQSFIERYPYCISQGKAFIGDAFFIGEGDLPKDVNEALKWYKKAYAIDHISPVEVGLANAYIAKGDKKSAKKYAGEAIEQPYAPAFVIAAQLSDNNVDKYAYLSEAVFLFKSPALDFWNKYNAYCRPNLSNSGLKAAESELAKIQLSQEELDQAKAKTKVFAENWKIKPTENNSL